jgi:hemoglobin/transferrin/lactoferrin receptor protein
MLKQLEVIYGPGSLMYGSDALGGFVHFRTRNPQLSVDENIKLKSTVGARYASANQEKTLHAHVEVSSSKIGSMTSFSYSDFGDLRAGNKRKIYPDFGKLFDYVQRKDGVDQVLSNDDPNVQIGTGYKQWDFMQKFIYNASKTTQYFANFQWSNSSNIPRYDQLMERSSDGIPSFSEWYYGPQQRKLISLKGQYGRPTKIYDRAQWLIAFQDIDEDRHTRNFQERLLENRLEDLQAWNVNLDFNKQLSSKFKINLEYGAEYIYNKLSSTAFLKDVNNGSMIPELSTRYPNGKNTWQTEGVYAILRKYNQKENLALHAGARFSAAQLFISYMPGDGFTWPDFFYEGIKSNNAQGTTSIGLKYKNMHGLQINLLGSTAFRAPNIDDFAKIRVKGDDATVPNVNLKPEKSINAELSIQQHIENNSEGGLTLSSTFFITRLKDAIVRKNYTLPDGTNTIRINNRIYNAQANLNAEQAILYGISGQFEYIFNKYMLQGGINYIRGTSDDHGEENPLAHIPPVYGNFVFHYSSISWKYQAGYYFNGAKSLSDFAPGSSDNEQYATPEGSLSWGIINASITYSWTKNISMTLGVDNILDIHYRPFSSGVSAPGRNFRFSLLTEF